MSVNANVPAGCCPACGETIRLGVRLTYGRLSDPLACENCGMMLASDAPMSPLRFVPVLALPLMMFGLYSRERPWFGVVTIVAGAFAVAAVIAVGLRANFKIAGEA